jgi:D-amino peptidase
MKVYISVDIEGITTTTTWKETRSESPGFPAFAKQMTDETLAVIEGAKKAGAKEIVVKDAHGTGDTIDPTAMPSGVTLLRGWTGHPFIMVEGIDKTFDALMFVGYHSAAGIGGNPMSHTLSLNINHIKVNGITASEFLLHSFAAAFEGVPTVFLSGDKRLCEDSQNLHPKLITCPVKDGCGGMTINYPVHDTLKNLRELSEKALKQDLKSALLKLPESFEVEIRFKDHITAEKASHYPNVKRINDETVTFSSNDYYDIMRTILWIS